VVTYHPAYLLRSLHDKAKAWEDLLLARRTVGASLYETDPVANA
jgi:DNA polymerase